LDTDSHVDIYYRPALLSAAVEEITVFLADRWLDRAG
jgi:hypothetical protein